MNYIDNNILLLHRHLVVTRQTQSSSEYISTNINSCSGYIGVALPTTVPLCRYERIRPVDRLHTHGLP